VVVAREGKTNWSFKQLNLRWYEYLWALLPLGLVSIGGAVGGICGSIAIPCNLQVMRSNLKLGYKYLATGLFSLLSVGCYIGLSKVLIITILSGTVVSAQVDQALKNSATFAAIQKADPLTYQKMRDAMIKAAEAHGSQAEINAAARPYLAGITRRYLPGASDNTVLDFTRVMTLEIDQIGAKDADACVAFINPSSGSSPLALDKLLTPELMQQDAAVTAAIIESGSQSPQPVPAKTDISDTLNRVARQMVSEFGSNDVIALSKPGSLSHDRFCVMTSEFYKQILILPRTSAVPLLRFLYSQNAAI
jgi:hypothetical protein